MHPWALALELERVGRAGIATLLATPGYASVIWVFDI
jgi:hypothetical protein